MSEGYFQRNEGFSVVLVKKDLNPMTAKPDDFRRVDVQAPEPGVAYDDPEVLKIAGEGYRAVECVGQGKPSDYESMARQRAAAAE